MYQLTQKDKQALNDYRENPNVKALLEPRLKEYAHARTNLRHELQRAKEDYFSAIKKHDNLAVLVESRDHEPGSDASEYASGDTYVAYKAEDKMIILPITERPCVIANDGTKTRKICYEDVAETVRKSHPDIFTKEIECRRLLAAFNQVDREIESYVNTIFLHGYLSDKEETKRIADQFLVEYGDFFEMFDRNGRRMPNPDEPVFTIIGSAIEEDIDYLTMNELFTNIEERSNFVQNRQKMYIKPL